MSQFLVVDCIDVPTGFDAHAAPGPTSRCAICGRHVNVLAGVELEGWFGAQGFKMDLGAGMMELDQHPERPWSSVDWDRLGVVVDDEAVIRTRLLGTQDELFVRWYAWKRFDLAL